MSGFALFLAGAYLSLRTIAALYGVLDLWYTMATAWPRVFGAIAGWFGAAGLLVALAGTHRRAVAWGMLAYLLWYLSLHGLRHLFMPPVKRRILDAGSSSLTGSNPEA